MTRPTLLLLFLAGCSASGDPPLDGGAFADAAEVVEAGMQFDASTDASHVSDAAYPDGGPIECPIGECDPRANSPCGSDAFCSLRTAVPSCEMTIGTGAEGSACRDVADCEEGLACFDTGAGGVCGRPCCPSGIESCPGGQACTGAGYLIDGTSSLWWRCVEPRSCDLWADDACAPGDACYVVSEMGDTECLRAGEGTVGASCALQNDCAPGHVCTGATPERRSCRLLCRLSAGASACPIDEGNCQAYPHTPEGSGICTPAARTPAP